MVSPDPELAGPLSALRRHWIVALVLTLLGGGAGVAAGAAIAPTYTAEARVAVGSTDLSALSIPGYALGSQQLAANISRYIGQIGATAAVQAALGASAGSVTALSASPVPESNIVRVEATAGDKATARAAADATAQYLVDQSSAVNGGGSSTALLATYTDLSRQVAAQGQVRDAAQAALKALSAGSPATAAAMTSYVAATAQYDNLAAQREAAQAAYQTAAANTASTYKLVGVSPGADSSNTARSNVERYGLVGVAGGFLVALGLVTALSRRTATRRHVRRSQDSDVEDGRTADVDLLDRTPSS